MNLNALKLFVTSAEAGSFSEASRLTGIPLPTLSRLVRKLEDQLGVRLLDRSPNGLALTPAGTQMLAEAGPALHALTQAEQRLFDSSGVAGTLRLSMPPHIEPLWDVFQTFGRRYPAVSFDIFATDRRVDLVADGIDVAIRVGDAGPSSYVGRTLTRYRHRVVAAPRLLSQHAIAVPDDLHSVPCACWYNRGPTAWSLGTHEVQLRPVLATNDYSHLLSLAASGNAVVEVPPFLVRESLRDGSLVEVLADYPMPEQPMRALVVERRAMSPLVRQFLEYASDNVAGALSG